MWKEFATIVFVAFLKNNSKNLEIMSIRNLIKSQHIYQMDCFEAIKNNGAVEYLIAPRYMVTLR